MAPSAQGPLRFRPPWPRSFWTSAVFILIQTSAHSGHWVSLTRRGNKLFYMDSYGTGVDGELRHISPHLRYELGEKGHYLAELIAKSNFHLSTNHFQYQSHDEDITTCGRWNVDFVKCIFDGGDFENFKSQIRHLANIYKTEYPDDTKDVFDRISCVLYDSY